MRAFVVGGAGFVGSHLVDRLLAEGHTVDVLDNLSSGSLGNLADARAAGSGALKFHHLDAAATETDASLAGRRPDVVYHLVGTGSGASTAGVGDPIGSLLTVLEAARRHRIPKVVVTLPASALYGHPANKELPVKEREPAALVARGVRGVIARALLDLLVVYREVHAIEFAALLMATVYGPRQRPEDGVVAALEAAVASGTPPTITGDGRQTRDLLHVDDAVDALVRASERGGGVPINIGSGQQTSINELWMRLAGRVGSTVEAVHVPGRPDELQRFAVSPVRARIHLGWSPWTELDEGLASLG